MRILRKAGVIVLGLLFMLCTVSIVIAEPDIGTGVLTIWLDANHTNPVPLDGNGHYLLDIGVQYYFLIKGIQEPEFRFFSTILIKIGYTDINGMPQTYQKIWSYDSNLGRVAFYWTPPNTAKICTTGTVHYKTPDMSSPDYLCKQDFATIPGHFHVIPENYLGPLGVLGAGALAMVAFATVKRRSIRIPRIS